MRFLDIDLDFFLNRNAYYSGSDALRQGDDYKPWSDFKVKNFLETRCGLSRDRPIPGRVIESHDLVVRFWQDLIEHGDLKLPFDIVHIDAHPDMSVRGGLSLVSGRLYVDPANSLTMFEEDYVHSGNYLTFAIARGWVASLVWIPLRQPTTGRENESADPRLKLKARKAAAPLPGDLSGTQSGVPFKVLSRHDFKTRKPFDYMILSRSPAFTPPASDALVPVISSYMNMI
jgi:hypothetical protein